MASALAVLLVDGEPGLEPLSGEVDFLKAALAPTGDPSPLVAASTVTAREFKAEALRGSGWRSWPTSTAWAPSFRRP